MGNINRTNPTIHVAGTTISDLDYDSASKGNLLGTSSYYFAGSSTGIATSQSVAANGSVLFNSTSLLEWGSVFPGNPVALTITATAAAATTITVRGYNGNLNISETITVVTGTSTMKTVNTYTTVNSISTLLALTNVSVGTVGYSTAKTLGVNQPQLAASLDVNSSGGAILYPRASATQIKAFDSTVDNITYASCDGMRVYNTTTDSFCEKSAGKWSGLLLEDPMKASTKKLTVFLSASTLSTIGNGTKYQILPPLPIYPANSTGLGVSQSSTINTAAILNGTMPFPSNLVVTLTGTATGGFSALVTGYYNGVLISEPIGGTGFTSGSFTSVAKFTSITSIVPLTGTGTFTVSYGYAASNPCYIVYKAVTFFNPSSTANTGTGTIGLNVTSTTYGTYFTLLSVAQLTQTNNNGSLTVVTYPVQLCSTTKTIGGTSSVYFSNNGTTFGVPSNNCSAIVTIEYDIVW